MAATIAPRDAWTFAGFPAWPPFVKERAVVTGADIVAWLDQNQTKGETADAVANAMLDRGLVAATGRRGNGFDAAGGDDAPWRAALFRLSDHACEPVGWPNATMGAINARRRWRGSTRRPARLVASDLRARILSMYDEHLSPDGTFVDYAAMAESPAFEAYVDATAELQTVDLRELKRDEKIAFFINVYNAMIVHVTCAVGPPTRGFSTNSRSSTGSGTTSAACCGRATTSSTARCGETGRARLRLELLSVTHGYRPALCAERPEARALRASHGPSRALRAGVRREIVPADSRVHRG